MPNPAPTTPAAGAPAPNRWRKLLRRLMLAGIALFILLLAAFFLFPIWISNDQGRLYVLDRLNDRLHGPRVSVDHWSLGWFRTTELTNLKITAPDGTTILTCPHVSSGLTLWDIVWSNYDIRNTTADQLEFRIAKYADGTTSLDSFALQEGGAGDILRSARGALQINGGQFTIYSAKANQTLACHDVKATVSIASPDAPFRLEIKAIADPGQALSLTGTFPPTRALSAQSLRAPGIWSLASDTDFVATSIPTALACDFLAVDSAWVDSFGPTLESINFASHAPAAGARPNTYRLSLSVTATPRASERASLDAKFLLQPPTPGTGGTLLVSGTDTLHLALRQSPPLSRLLGRLNPVLGEISPIPVGLVQGTVSNLTLPLDHPEKSSATLRLTFPPMVFTSRDGPSLLRQLQVSFGETPRPNARVEGGAEPLRAKLDSGQFSYENFLVTLGNRRLNFAGSVSLDGKVDLSALIPDSSPGLSLSTSRVVITGTVETPLLKRAE